MGPAIVFADLQQTIFLADMTGDGLTDIVRIRNGEICYWANKGYGCFSAKVTNCLEQTETKHKKALDSLLTLKFQTFSETKLVAL